MADIKNYIGKIIQGEALEELKKLPDECIDLIITSPPYYGLRKYGDYEQQIGLEKTFDEFLKKILEITGELKRVLKPNGQFWLNFGDCYGGAWGSGSREGSKQATNKGTLSQPIEEFGRQAIGGDKCLMMMPERIALKMIDEQGWILRNKIKWAKQVLLYKDKITKGSVMPTSVKDRFNESGEELYFFVKNKKYFSNLDAVRLPNQVLGVTDFRASGLVRSAELYPNSKYATAESQGKIDGRVSKHIKPLEARAEWKTNYSKGMRYGGELSEKYKDSDIKGNILGKNLPTVWLIGSEPHNFSKELELSDVDHFAIFPQALVEIPIKFGTKPGDLVLDPFMGSGTVAVMARKLGRNYIGIELNSDYIKIAERRLRQELLF